MPSLGSPGNSAAIPTRQRLVSNLAVGQKPDWPDDIASSSGPHPRPNAVVTLIPVTTTRAPELPEVLARGDDPAATLDMFRPGEHLAEHRDGVGNCRHPRHGFVAEVEHYVVSQLHFR